MARCSLSTTTCVTVSCLEVPIEEAAGAFGVLSVNEEGRIIDFQEKPENPTPLPGRPDLCLASMGNYLFNTDFLYEQLIKDADYELPLQFKNFRD